jgi:hypothetical protein
MISKRNLSSLVLTCILVACSQSAPAAWEEDGNVVGDTAGGDYQTTALPDGEGGAFVAYTHRPPAGLTMTFVQRIDPFGQPLWPEGGFPSYSGSGYCYDPQLLPDGEGGCFVVSASTNVYMQRFDADGTRPWGDAGITVCGAPSNQMAVQLTTDGAGGAILCWIDYRDGVGDIYAQRIAADGTSLWTADGVPVCTAVADQYQPQIVSDDDGGAIVTWYDMRSGGSVCYIQRLDADGAAVWPTDGIIAIDPISFQNGQMIMADGRGGAVVVMNHGGRLDMQRVDEDGVRLWGTAGIPTAPGNTSSQNSPHLMYDGVRGFFLGWSDYRNGNYDIYVQHFDLDGIETWTSDGVMVLGGLGRQTDPAITGDGFGGLYVVCEDDLAGHADIRIRRVNADGAPVGAAEGDALCSAAGDQLDPHVVTDGDYGVIVVWDDVRNGSQAYIESGAYAQRMERNGHWGYPAPELAVARDVPGDQGGQVYLAWTASRLDSWADTTVKSYSLWRALNAPGKALPDLDGIPEQELSVEIVDGKALYWQMVAALDAGFTQTYSLTVPTLFDSTATSLERHHFRVVAHGATPNEYWTSASDSCRSVDDLAPGAPQMLAAAVEGADIRLSWDPSGIHDEDLAHYNLYRSTSPGFAPDEVSFLATVADTAAVDPDPGAGTFYYVVTAVDVHDNEGPISNEALITSVTGVRDGVPGVTALLGNRPNPFNPSTRISFDLARSGRVELAVYDLGGRLVRRLIGGAALEEGRHEVNWDGRDAAGRAAPAGTYLYRLATGGLQASGRMSLVK